jgi:hypothetical protein
MALLNSSPSKIAFGFGLGLMTAELFKELMPVLRELRRPLLKAAVQSGEILARNGRIKLAEFRETLADVKAEVQAQQPFEAAQPPLDDALASDKKHTSGIM